MTKLEKALNEAAQKFEDRVKRGKYLDGEKISFVEFTETWFKDYAEKQLKPKTLEGYRRQLNDRIIPAIGHHKLARIQPPILIRFLNALQEPGINRNMRYKAKPGIKNLWKKSKLTAESTGLDRHVLTSILSCGNVAFSSAEKFTTVIKKYDKRLKIKDLFEPAGKAQALSAITIGHYLRCISSILSTAVEWQIIETNPCERVKAPKMVKRQIKFMEIDEAQAVIKAAMNLDNIQIKTAILVFLYTGIRKSEFTGLQWSDIDFEKGIISINRIVQQIDGQGLVVGTPKTDSGTRSIFISSDLVSQLRHYKLWQNTQKVNAGDQWQTKEREMWVSGGTEKELRKADDFQAIEWVFTGSAGYPIHPSTTYHWIKKFLTDNGHPDMTVHGLRHTNISLLLSQGVDLITVSRRAGHAKPSITADIYAHALKKPDEDAAEKLNDLFSSSFAIISTV